LLDRRGAFDDDVLAREGFELGELAPWLGLKFL